jgi:Tfp pilus assembly protein PilF
MFQALVDSGQRALTREEPAQGGRGGRGGRGGAQTPRLRSANAHYTIGLGYLGLGDAAKAKSELSQAVETSPDLLGARTALAALK